MKNQNYAYANPKHPFIGLDNQNCKYPRHWCAFHKVWLSEADAKCRHCRHRTETGDPCLYFIENHYKKGINSLLRKSRKVHCKGSKYYY